MEFRFYIRKKDEMNLIRGFFIAFSMYSKIPMPRTEWTKDGMKYFLCFFPLVGIPIGALWIAWMYLARFLEMGSILQTAGLVLIPVAVTGGIHLDGLLDTSDALSSYKSMEEKLEILKDSHAGAFAVITGISYFTAYFGILSEADLTAVCVMAIGFVMSRSLSGLAMVTFKMAKNTGLAATFSDMAARARVRIVMVVYVLACAAAMIMLRPVEGTAGVVGALLTFAFYRRMSYRKFGGITGDLAGFFLQICELVIAICVVFARMITV